MPARYGRTVRRSGQAHQAGHRLYQQVVAGKCGALTRPEAADRAVDDGRVTRCDRLVVQPEPAQCAGPEVLDHHVRSGGELVSGREVGVVSEVECDGPLVAIDRRIVGAEFAAQRRYPVPGVIAGRGLDLDHVGT